MKAIIVEDEAKNISKLRSLLEKFCPSIELAGTAMDADSGIVLIGQTKPDLLFLDIQMPGKSGFDMLAELGNYEFEVIFVTAFDQYGIKAIKFSALDYLLKPVKPKDLILAVEKAIKKSGQKRTSQQIANLLQQLNSGNKADHRIILPFMKEYRYLKPEEIIRCEALNSYTSFYLNNGEKLTVSSLLREYEEILVPYGFIRCHQSHLVNRLYIKSLLKDDNISELLLTDKTKIPVSRLKRELVKDAFEK